MPRPRALLCLNDDSCDRIYGPAERAGLDARLDWVATPLNADDFRERLANEPAAFADVQMLVSGWGCPVLDADLLNAMPQLQALFYGAGSIKRVMTDAAWDRGIRVTTAYAMNAVPVAEFTVSQIVFCLKWGYQHLWATKKTGPCTGGPTSPGPTDQRSVWSHWA